MEYVLFIVGILCAVSWWIAGQYEEKERQPGEKKKPARASGKGAQSRLTPKDNKT